MQTTAALIESSTHGRVSNESTGSTGVDAGALVGRRRPGPAGPAGPAGPGRPGPAGPAGPAGPGRRRPTSAPASTPVDPVDSLLTRPCVEDSIRAAVVCISGSPVRLLSCFGRHPRPQLTLVTGPSLCKRLNRARCNRKLYRPKDFR